MVNMHKNKMEFLVNTVNLNYKFHKKRRGKNVKKLTKILSMVLVFALCLSCFVPAVSAASRRQSRSELGQSYAMPSFEDIFGVDSNETKDKIKSFFEDILTEEQQQELGQIYDDVVDFGNELKDAIESELNGEEVLDTTNSTAYAIYSTDDYSLTFIRAKEAPVVGELYNGKTISAVYTGFETEVYECGEYITTPWWMDGIGEIADTILTVKFDNVIQPQSTAAWFAQLSNCTLVDLTNLDTSLVTNMNNMFCRCGREADNFTIIGLDALDTSNVTVMHHMFRQTAQYATEMNLGGIENMDVSAVTDMQAMFSCAGYDVTNFKLDLSAWDVSNVTNMSWMFESAGKNSETFELAIENWDVSSVTDMRYAFESAGYAADYLLDLSGWNVQNVTQYTEFNRYTTDKVIAPNWAN